MKDITVIILDKEYTYDNKDIEVLCTDSDKIKEKIKEAKGKYISFINAKDLIDEKYFEKVIKKSKEEFDCCFINYEYLLDIQNNKKILKNKDKLKENKPYYKDYIFSYIFKKDKLLKLINIDDKDKFNETVDKEFEKRTAIEEVIYYHKPNQKNKLSNFIYSNVKKQIYNKNVIYVASGCNGIFNGYISWICHLGELFHDKYDITILYDNIHETTLKRFQKYFNCIQREIDNIYLCDNLLVTYTSYFYPKNIVNLEESYLFIHGNMSDYENAIRYKDDIYTHYVAVSKTAAEKAEGYYPTDTIEYVLNPYKLDEKRVKPRIKLTSTLRSTPVKRIDRIEKMAKMFDELEIPYTWEVFTDKKENTNVNGLIFRRRVSNPMPYVADSDYFVLLSDSESYSYSVIEALSVNTKVIVIPLPVYKEIGVKDKENACLIPPEYFDDGNEDKLKKVLIKLYKEKDKEINYKLDETMWEGYNKIFT